MQIVTDKTKKELKQHGNTDFPLLVSRERLSRYESGSFMWHWHKEMEITYIEKGEMLYSVNHETFHLKEGDVIFDQPNALHSGRMHNHIDCDYIAITLDLSYLYGSSQSVLYKKYILPLLSSSNGGVVLDQTCDYHKEAIQYIKQIIQVYEKKEDLMALDITLLLFSVIRLLYIHRGQENTLPTDKSNLERIRSIVEYIKMHYQEKITLQDVAQNVHMCRSECSRLFSQYMKVPLFEYVLEYRIEQSVFLLLQDTLSITEIAELVGFSDSNYFSKVFSRFKGCSPRSFKKMQIETTKI